MRKLVDIVCMIVVLIMSLALQQNVAQAAEDSPQFIMEWGGLGSASSQFNLAQRIGTDAAGNIYVLDYNNGRVQKFSGYGEFLTAWPVAGLDGMAVDAEGHVYVSNSYLCTITKYSCAGVLLTQWGSRGSDDGQFEDPGALAVDSGGFLYVADISNSRIQKFTSDGTYLTQWGSLGSGDGQFNYPSALSADNNSCVYVVDLYNYRVEKFTNDGTFLTQWGSLGSGDGQWERSFGITADNAGSVYLLDFDHNRVQQFNSGGTYLTQWGTGGIETGQFASPEGIATDADGNVFVADTQNNRVQKFGVCSTSGTLPDCRLVVGPTLLFGPRFSSDASTISLPAGEVAYTDSTTVMINKTSDDVFFLSGKPDSLVGWVADDNFFIGDSCVGQCYSGASRQTWPLCMPMDHLRGCVPARDITALLPNGQYCLTFRLADTDRNVFGNSAIYVIKRSLVGVGSPSAPAGFTLATPQPNPVLNQTTIGFSLPHQAPASLAIFDASGRRVMTWQWSGLSAGRHTVRWDGRSEDGRTIAPGILFYRLTSGANTLQSKLVHLQ